ncbi:MAG: phosphoribosyltransferase [Planctomycetota bacterium]|jgi:putative phosphoribosyl transferase
MFADRKEAGQKLAGALAAYRDESPIVLAIPRGGVEVGYYVAKYLRADFSILVARKLPFPDNPEAGFGAVAEDGSTFMIDYAAHALSRQTIERIVAQQEAEIERRVEVLRKGRPLPEISGRTVILVDDGIAMGSTMRASIQLCRNKKARRIIVASPVSGPSTAAQFVEVADDVVILETPRFFRAVADVYANWYDVPDEEVIAVLERWEANRDNTS